MGIIIFNGESSEDYNVVVEHPPNYSYPQKDYDVTHVPGRNGDVIVDKGSWQNVNREYEIAFYSKVDRNFERTASGVSQWLNTPSGYARLEDTYEQEYYRMACYNEAQDLENLLMVAGRATIAFTCKPQRFLKSGEVSHTFTKDGLLKNPTTFPSKPKLVIHGEDGAEGTLAVNNTTIYLSKIIDGMIIDSELQDAYADNTNCNPYLYLSDGEFPELTRGVNLIQLGTNITSVEVIPRWWIL